MVEPMRPLAPAVVAALLAAACGSEPPKAPPDRRDERTVAILASFEVRDDGVDRFEHCPPAGEIGSDWLPPIPEWHPPASSASAAVPGSAVDETDTSASSTPADDTAHPDAPVGQAELTDEAATKTRAGFRHCYHTGLLYDPTQDGHVGVVMHVDRTGHVAQVETWGACDIAHTALVCMRDVASSVRLHPPADGSATVTVPALFTNDNPHAKAPNDSYTAKAYVAVETMRPRLHNCIDTARRAGVPVIASAVMTIDTDERGKGVHIAVDQWKGGHELLACAAEVLRDAPFPRPPASVGRVVVPIVFNPRPGTR
jgi:hypothetical protein